MQIYSGGLLYSQSKAKLWNRAIPDGRFKVSWENKENMENIENTENRAHICHKYHKYICGEIMGIFGEILEIWPQFARFYVAKN